jgi:glucan biosynthesis protein
VVETFIASPRVPGATEAPPPGARRFVLDIAGESMSYDVAFIERIKADVSGQPGQATLVALRPNPNIEGVRLVFDAVPEAGKAMDLRASLSMDGQRLSEVWFFTLHPDG